jgi:hypothetical protein
MLDAVGRRLGVLPKPFKVSARSPACLEGFLSVSVRLVRQVTARRGGVTRKELAASRDAHFSEPEGRTGAPEGE